MLATLADPKQLPRGEGWEFEIKWDGYRIVSRVAGGEAELRTRKDQDYTAALRQRRQASSSRR